MLAFLEDHGCIDNVLLSVFQWAADDARCWWAECDGAVTAVAVCHPASMPVQLSHGDPDAAAALAVHIASDFVPAVGVSGPAATTARFASAWGERRRVPVTPAFAQRLHSIRLDDVPDLTDDIRVAVASDRDRLVPWAHELVGSTHAGGTTVDDFLERHLTRGSLRLLVDGEPVAMAALSPAGRQGWRISAVYTPDALRGRGYATRCVSALLSEAAARGGRTCVLYTDLDHPASLSVYQRVGFRHVEDTLTFRFGG